VFELNIFQKYDIKVIYEDNEIIKGRVDIDDLLNGLSDNDCPHLNSKMFTSFILDEGLYIVWKYLKDNCNITFHLEGYHCYGYGYNPNVFQITKPYAVNPTTISIEQFMTKRSEWIKWYNNMGPEPIRN
jgi:hypothetical protein